MFPIDQYLFHVFSRNLKEWDLHPWYWYVWWSFWFYTQVSFHISKNSKKRFVFYWHFWICLNFLELILINSPMHLLWRKTVFGPTCNQKSWKIITYDKILYLKIIILIIFRCFALRSNVFYEDCLWIPWKN